MTNNKFYEQQHLDYCRPLEIAPSVRRERSNKSFDCYDVAVTLELSLGDKRACLGFRMRDGNASRGLD